MVYLKIKSRFKIARDMLGNMMEKFEEKYEAIALKMLLPPLSHSLLH